MPSMRIRTMLLLLAGAVSGVAAGCRIAIGAIDRKELLCTCSTRLPRLSRSTPPQSHFAWSWVIASQSYRTTYKPYEQGFEARIRSVGRERTYVCRYNTNEYSLFWFKTQPTKNRAIIMVLVLQNVMECVWKKYSYIYFCSLNIQTTCAISSLATTFNHKVFILVDLYCCFWKVNRHTIWTSDHSSHKCESLLT